MITEIPATPPPQVPDLYRNYEAISRGKREWEQTFDAVPDLILIIDTDHTISRVNRAMADRCGLAPAQLPGRKCYEIFHGTSAPPDFCPLGRLMQDGRAQSVEIEEAHLGGASFEITVSPLYDPAGELVACVHVARDLTERKRIEAERLALEHQLQQAQKLESLGVLAGGIAHDFNNILMIILGHCFLGKEEVDAERWEASRLKQIELAANRAGDLCRQMLAYAGRSPLHQAEMDLAVLVKEIVAMLKSGIRKNVSLEAHLGRNLPTITGDKGKLQQIVMNLVVNAAEAIGETSGVVRVRLNMRIVEPGAQPVDFFGNAIAPGSYVCLTVEDTGCGMDPETQQRIFEPFFTTKFTGRGLGLSAMLGILRSHNGALQLTSTPGAGTTFTVYFPAAPAKGAAKKEERAAAPQRPWINSTGREKGTVLLVDDEQELRRIGSEMLSAMGYITVCGQNGREAVELFRTRGSSIDLILMDLTMPEMDGIEAYEEIRRMSLSVPIVICSGYGKYELSSYIRDDRHAAVVPKPYQPDDVHGVLARLLTPAAE